MYKLPCHLNKLNIQMKKIHDFHMQVSYNKNSKLYDFLETHTHINKKCFDRNLCICIDEKYRFNVATQIIQKIINDNNNFDVLNNMSHAKPTMLDNVNTQIDDVMNTHSQQTCDFITEMINSYTEMYQIYNKINNVGVFMNGVLALCMDFVHKGKHGTIAVVVFLGFIEWFSINVLLLAIHERIIGCETLFILTDLLDMNVVGFEEYEQDELDNFMKDEYNAHTVLTIIHANDFITIIDSDQTDIHLVEKKIKQFATYINVNFYKTRLKYPIQTITDDNYCIFHSIQILLMLSEITNFTWTNLSNLVRSYDKKNRRSTLANVEQYISTLQFNVE